MPKNLRVLRNCACILVGALFWGVALPSAFAEDKNSIFTKSPEEFKRLRPVPKLPPLPAPRPLPVVAPIPVIEEIEGADRLNVTGSHGSRSVKLGDGVDFGEWVQTGDRVSVKVLFHDGSQVLIGEASEIGIERPSTDSGEPAQVPVVNIRKGEARILIENEGQKKSTYRFLSRTKSVVMGVRGTDFVVAAHDDHASVHTVSGIVDVAPDFSAFRARKVISVGAGKAVEAQKGKGIQTKVFALDPYLKDLYARHSHFEGMWNRASLDLKNKKYKGIRFPTGIPIRGASGAGVVSQPKPALPKTQSPGIAGANPKIGSAENGATSAKKPWPKKQKKGKSRPNRR